LLKRKQRYLEAGTLEVWLISIEAREVAVYPENRILLGSDRLATPLIPGFSITVDDLFR
jgi:Uma2 family endonuclease